MKIQSEHKSLTGTIGRDEPFMVEFVNGQADVDDAVGEYLLRHRAASLAPDLTIDSMNVPQLKKYAKDNNIDIGEAKTKAEILTIIEAAGQPPGGTDGNEDGKEGNESDPE